MTVLPDLSGMQIRRYARLLVVAAVLLMATPTAAEWEGGILAGSPRGHSLLQDSRPPGLQLDFSCRGNALRRVVLLTRSWPLQGEVPVPVDFATAAGTRRWTFTTDGGGPDGSWVAADSKAIAQWLEAQPDTRSITLHLADTAGRPLTATYEGEIAFPLGVLREGCRWG